MENQNEMVNPFEFVLSINDNIICQRYFNIKNYNEDFRESLEVREMLDEVMGMSDSYELGIIPNFFKKKCVDKLWSTYNSSYLQNTIRVKDIYEIPDNFHFQVMVNKEVVAATSCSANLYQYNVRRNIDVRDIIPEIVRTVSHYMSLKNYTKEYSGIKLNRHNILDGVK